jgi:hypothetical protein
MHAVNEQEASPLPHVARIGVDEGGDTDYRCACLPAEAVGIGLEE